MGIKEFLKPNWMKIILSITWLVPVLIFCFILFGGINAQAILLIFIIAIIISYAIGSCLDYFIRNKTVKIIIASLSGLLSIAISYIVVRSITGAMVCDPVHNPIICDPVHQPSQCEAACNKIMDQATNVTDVVSQKFQECLQNCTK